MKTTAAIKRWETGERGNEKPGKYLWKWLDLEIIHLVNHALFIRQRRHCICPCWPLDLPFPLNLKLSFLWQCRDN